MSRFLKWTIIAGGSLAAVLVLVILLLPSMIEVERYRPLIEREASQALGRPVTLAGPLDLSIFPWIGVEVGDLAVGNPEGFSEPNLLSVETAEIRVAVLPLLRRAVEVNRFILRSPEITLERTADGRANWEDIGPAETAPSESEGAAPPEAGPAESSPASKSDAGGAAIAGLTVDELAIRDGRVVWIDQTADLRRKISDLDLQIEHLSLDQAVGLELSASLDGHPVQLSGEVGPVGTPPGTGTIPLSLTLSALDEISLELSGSVTDPAGSPSADLTLALDPFSPRAATETLDQPFPVKTADPKALTSVGLQLHFKGGPDTFSISDGVLSLDDRRIAFSAQLRDGKSPDLAAALSADELDVTRYLPPQEEATADPAENAPQNADAAAGFNPAWLQTAKLDLSFSADRLVLPGVALTDASATVAGKAGRFDLDVSAQRDGRPLSLAGTVGPVSADRAPLSLDLNGLDLLKARISGAVDRPATAPLLDAEIAVAPFAPRKLADALGVAFPLQTRDPSALGRVGFDGKVRAGATSLRVQNGELTLDETTVRIDLNVPAVSPLNLNGELGLDRIDLDRYLPPEASEKTAASGPSKPGKGAGVDYAPLRRVRLSAAFRADAIRVRGLDLTDIRFQISGEEGIFRLDPLDVNLYRGAMSLTGRFDVTGPEPVTRADLMVRDVAVGPLLTAAADNDLLTGTLKASAQLSTQGDQVETATRHLDGTADLRLSDGRIKGMNLVNMARNIEAAFRKARGEATAAPSGTAFTDLQVATQFADGRATLTDARLTSPVLEATAEGSVDLAERTLDIRMTPTFLQPVGKGRAVAVPVVIGGTFDQPTYRPDLARLIQIDTQKAVQDILQDPEKGVKELLDEQKDRIRSILNPDRSETPAESRETDAPESAGGVDSADASGEEKKKKDKPSAEDAVRNLLRSLPFGK